jgi:hypothetical protein
VREKARTKKKINAEGADGKSELRTQKKAKTEERRKRLTQRAQRKQRTRRFRGGGTAGAMRPGGREFRNPGGAGRISNLKLEI